MSEHVLGSNKDLKFWQILCRTPSPHTCLNALSPFLMEDILLDGKNFRGSSVSTRVEAKCYYIYKHRLSLWKVIDNTPR
jgi:hypothetical protein